MDLELNNVSTKDEGYKINNFKNIWLQDNPV
jgi:hypothetical protein